MQKIKLSILIPTYNFKFGINKILECINRIDPNISDFVEIIISDDSKNKVINSHKNLYFKKSLKNFIYIHNKKSLGAVKNWNKLLSIARGDYIWLLHHDEFWNKEKNVIKYILENIDKKKPNILILPVKTSKILRMFFLYFNLTHKHIISRNLFISHLRNPKLLLKLNVIGPPSALIYKKNNLIYDKKLKFLVDIDFYIRLLKYFKSENILLAKNNYNLISSQNNKSSITSSLKKEINSELIK